MSKSKYYSIFIAEAFAIKAASEIMYNKNNVNKDIIVIYIVEFKISITGFS